jgi:hypothetical protein
LVFFLNCAAPPPFKSSKSPFPSNPLSTLTLHQHTPQTSNVITIIIIIIIYHLLPSTTILSSFYPFLWQGDSFSFNRPWIPGSQLQSPRIRQR